ncbi:MAG: hypothetical protein COU85_01170 [Candidatus Portnoybacteria bacterium CG10_big_fil_rev_8_21_14_0_10_44_7]|uniref:Glycosyl transferase family 1 domain-containing protein n=1 Tax=Candidatus Portnoybacteria bacterium CG10_big_fil_rev_8_21_14_0_10_44_7 TaxID=1974816 RepID=A0A2M8KJ15_9BACT|nr:MAG: hypothetical protein COU85_01170 [Candidatus Portnoybacteria bacterium CG10_big_fil_rev_8_21_14_0_10_44_7]
MKKVCYILPKYDPQTDTHFAYLYEFLKAAADRLDIFLIVEKHTVKNIVGNFTRIYWQKFSCWPLRIVELAIVLKLARWRGYRNFYTHYSYIGAFLAGIISRFTFARSFYWNCASAWNLNQRLKSRIGLWLALKTTKFLVTGTEGLKKEYVQRYKFKKDRIFVMPNWVDAERFSKDKYNKDKLREKYKIVTGKKVLLFVHHISDRKGSYYLVPIFKNLKSDGVLLVAGRGPGERWLTKRIQEADLDTKIKMLGQIPNKEVAELYAIADIFLMPSREEGFPRVLLEAMAAGVPFVAFDVGGVKEISPKIARDFILPVSQTKEFAQKVDELLNDYEIYSKFVSQGKEKVKEFSRTRAFEIFVNLFK